MVSRSLRSLLHAIVFFVCEFMQVKSRASVAINVKPAWHLQKPVNLSETVARARSMLSVAYAFVPLAHLLVNAKDTLTYRGAGRHRRATPPVCLLAC